MSKIIEWMSHWGKDKILHDDLVSAISLAAACVCKLFVTTEWQIITVCAFFAGFAFAIGKEIYDEIKHKGAAERDWAADIIGLVRGTLFSLILTI